MKASLTLMLLTLLYPTFSSALPDSSATPEKAELEAIKRVCSGCHNNHRDFTSEKIPNLKDQNIAYLENELKNFRCKSRIAPAMNWLTDKLTDGQIRELAIWVSTKSGAVADWCGTVTPSNDTKCKAEQVCESCHADNVTDDDLHPKIAGQKSAYMEAQLENFQCKSEKKCRQSYCMKQIAMKLTEQEIKELAAYYCLKGSPDPAKRPFLEQTKPCSPDNLCKEPK